MKTYHKCKAMPQGTVIEQVDITPVALSPVFFPMPKSFVWKMFYNVHGFTQQANVKFCPYCGEELEEPND